MRVVNRHAEILAEYVRRGGVQGGVPDDEKKADEKKVDEKKADEKKTDDNTAKLEAQLAEERAARAKLEKDLSDKKALEKKAADDKAIEEGKAKELLAAREKELETEKARVLEFEAREKKRAKALFDKLPKEEQEIAKDLEKQLSVSGFAEYLEKKVLHLPGGDKPPPNGTPGGGGGGDVSGKRKLSADSRELLEKNYANETAYGIAQHLQEVQLAAGEVKFTMGTDQFITMLKRRAKQGAELTTEGVNKLFAPKG